MKKITTLVLGATLLLTVACTEKTQQFKAADGSVTATHKLKSDQWKIVDARGQEPMTDYDSMRVVEVGEDGHPMTIVYYKGNEQLHLQYYSTMQLRSQGRVVDGQREGHWAFYHPSGIVQSECDFVNGLEQGPYHVYRENGVPYYIGQYNQGRPTGTWEIYDPEGNMVGTKEYGE